jgi:putative holliday junction resolvase
MRWLGVDVGKRRIGLAVSDDSATLARPWRTLQAASTVAGSAEAIARSLETFASEALEDAPFAGVVIGLPRRLNGEDTDQTAVARALAAAIGARTGLVVHLQDERLTSREAESQLAEREPDWRKRKTLIDPVAAAIVLQDFLDSRPDRVPAAPVTRT